eukprot:m.128232 g.128232  ORF g.128232 m.128232 type:complete len:73 (-) comp13621_c0_seq2:1183-1401(-)
MSESANECNPSNPYRHQSTSRHNGGYLCGCQNNHYALVQLEDRQQRTCPPIDGPDKSASIRVLLDSITHELN